MYLKMEHINTKRLTDFIKKEANKRVKSSNEIHVLDYKIKNDLSIWCECETSYGLFNFSLLYKDFLQYNREENLNSFFDLATSLKQK
jgi:hypothetical protein